MFSRMWKIWWMWRTIPAFPSSSFSSETSMLLSANSTFLTPCWKCCRSWPKISTLCLNSSDQFFRPSSERYKCRMICLFSGLMKDYSVWLYFFTANKTLTNWLTPQLEKSSDRHAEYRLKIGTEGSKWCRKECSKHTVFFLTCKPVKHQVIRPASTRTSLSTRLQSSAC